MITKVQRSLIVRILILTPLSLHVMLGLSLPSRNFISGRISSSIGDPEKQRSGPLNPRTHNLGASEELGRE